MNLTRRQIRVLATHFTPHERNELIRSLNACAIIRRTWNTVTPTCDRVINTYVRNRKMRFLDACAFRDMCRDYIINQGRMNTFRNNIRHITP